VKVGGSLGCSDGEMVEFRILRGRSRVISRLKTLDFRRANWPFQGPAWRNPVGQGLEGRDIQES